ncbi:MAG: ABC transporter permease [Lachnospiraceae bacterium]|nr:ABC transporter permease [Lachnospiraceae bacterium]
MNFDKIKIIYKKEIRELIRDKKMMFMMFALPLLIYPLLIILVASIVISFMTSFESKEYRVALSDNITDERMIEAIFADAAEAGPDDETVVLSENALVRNGSDEAGADADAESDAGSYFFTRVNISSDYETAIADSKINVYISYDEMNDEYSVYYNDSDSDSDHAADYISERLNGYKTTLIHERFDAAGIDYDAYNNPITYRMVDLASGEESVGNILGMIVPLLLMMGVMLGTMNAAADVTTGEKERGTQETLMTFPLSGRELLFGKFLAVATCGIVSALLYLISVGILGGFMYVVLEQAGNASVSISSFLPSIIVTVITVMIYSLFLSAVLMCVCSFAKSNKEASSYLSPIMTVTMLVSYAGYLDIGLNLKLSIVPVLNIVLLIKSVMTFEYDVASIVLVLLSNALYAVVAIMILGKMYTSERVLFGESGGSLLERNSKREKNSTPSYGDGILVLLISLVLYVYVGTLLQLKMPIMGLGAIQLIFVAVVIFAVWYGKVDHVHTLSLRKVSIPRLIGSLMTGMGAYIIGNLLLIPAQMIFSESAFKYGNSVTNIMSDQSFLVCLLVIAVSPAIGEELLFRGYLLGSLKNKIKPVWVILITAVIFGAYHMNIVQGIYAFVLGCILGIVIYLTGSIFCTMLMHFACNAISVCVSFYPDTMLKIMPMFSDDATGGTYALFAIIGLVFLAVGFALLGVFSKKKLSA